MTAPAAAPTIDTAADSLSTSSAVPARVMPTMRKSAISRRLASTESVSALKTRQSAVKAAAHRRSILARSMCR